MKKKTAQRLKTRLQIIKPYLFVAPAVIFLLAFTLYPALRQFYLSFFNTGTALSITEFAGAKQYRAMFSNPVFWETAKNTLVFGSLQVSLSVLAGLACALIANSRLNRLGVLFKTAVFYPYILPWSAAAMLWMYVFHPSRGPLNALLHTRIQWLNDFHLSLYALIFIAVWKTAGFCFLIFLSGLQSIPAGLYESFRLETNSRFRAFRHITLPMLGPAVFAAVLLSVAGSFQSADLIYIITQGRPGNSTNVLIYYIYQQGIAGRNIAYGSALGTVLFFILMLFTAGYIVLGERKVQYDR